MASRILRSRLNARKRVLAYERVAFNCHTVLGREYIETTGSAGELSHVSIILLFSVERREKRFVGKRGMARRGADGDSRGGRAYHVAPFPPGIRPRADKVGIA